MKRIHSISAVNWAERIYYMSTARNGEFTISYEHKWHQLLRIFLELQTKTYNSKHMECHALHPDVCRLTPNGPHAAQLPVLYCQICYELRGEKMDFCTFLALSQSYYMTTHNNYYEHDPQSSLINFITNR